MNKRYEDMSPKERAALALLKKRKDEQRRRIQNQPEVKARRLHERLMEQRRGR